MTERSGLLFNPMQVRPTMDWRLLIIYNLKATSEFDRLNPSGERVQVEPVNVDASQVLNAPPWIPILTDSLS